MKNILKAYGLEINESKSEYKKKEIEFLGHIIKEKVGFDIMESPGGEYVITAIDYFTREGFAKKIANRESKHVLRFLQEIHEKLNIKTLISDGAKENCDKKIIAWIKERGIKQHVTSAHHPESNGRIERFNKTVIDSLRKGKYPGVLQARLNKILEQYHDTYHEGLGTTPNEAIDSKNWDYLKQKQYKETLEKYKKKFKNGTWDKLKEGDKAILRMEVGRKKPDPLFKDKAKVQQVNENDSYLVRLENDKLLKRHISQLKEVNES